MKPQLDRSHTSFYEFGPFRLDPVKRLLLRNGESVPLTQKAFDTLLVLVRNSERVVHKDELMGLVWPDTIVEENNLTQSISMLRRALGESRKDHKYIVTIQGQGYRFVADVKEDVTNDAKAPPDIAQPNHQPALVRRLASTERVVVGLVLLIGLCAGLYLWRVYSVEPELNATTVRSVAVVPFKSLSADSGDEYLGTGIADALAAKLRHIGQINVPSSGSALDSSSFDHDALTVGRKLQVDSVLDGTIQKDADRIRVTVRLISVPDNKTLWSATFNEKVTEIFAVQDSISEQVATALRLKLTGGEQELLTKHYTENAEAYQAYIKGRYFWNKRSEAGLLKAIEYFRQAIHADPQYALAYAGLADSYLMMAAYHYSSLPPEEAVEIAKSSALQALELDDALAEAHTSLAGVLEGTSRDLPATERAYKRALELNPNYATARQWYAEFLRSTGRFDEALVELKRAQALDPLSPVMNSSLGVSYYYARQYDLVIEQNRKALEIDPNFMAAHFGLGLAFEQKEMYEEAIAAFQRAKELSKGGEPMVAALGHAYAKSGDRARAMRVLKELKKRETLTSPYSLALLYVAFGEKDKALPLLRKACEKAGGHLMLKLDPRLDALRSDSTFNEVFKS